MPTKVISVEPIVRPWFNKREPVNTRRVEKPPEDDGGEAVLLIGGPMPSQFDSNSGPGITLREEEHEVERTTHTKRVENEEDPAQFVDVEVIDEIYFRGPDGRIRKYVLDNED